MDIEIEDFSRAIGAVEPQPGNKHYSIFKSIFRRSNYFLLGDKFLMIKISRTKKPFWGIGKEFVDFLNNFDYFLVLLVSNDEGWVFSKGEVNTNIRNKKWNLREEDNNYKINPPLPDKNSFYSYATFIKKIGALD